MGFLAILLKTNVGRYAVIGLLLLLLFTYISRRLSAAGENKEKLKQAQRTIGSLVHELRSSNETLQMSHDERVDYLRGWMR